MEKQKLTGYILLAAVACCVLSYCIFLQFLSPTFYESDSYYHVATSSFIRDFGFRYNFHWTQFSVYKDLFGDKDFLFHLLTVPFLNLSNDIVVAGKYAIIFYNALFILIFVFILRKYLPDYLVCCFLFLPFLSATFTTYFLYLRSFTLANILTILGIYFLINKKTIGVFLVSLLYPLTHTSFFTIVVFAFICETCRWIFVREFFLRNLYLAVIGMLAGCLIHPNFPNNLLYTHLQFLVVNYANKGLDLGLGSELFSYPTMRVFIENFAVFLTLNIIFWIALISRKRISLSTAVWLICSNFYLLLALTADRHWYITNILVFIAFASYLKDWEEMGGWDKLSRKVSIFIAVYLISIFLYFPAGIKSLEANINLNTILGNHYKQVALWMKEHIPPGKLIYHNNWSDSAYFLCFNPNNNYLVVLDPIYMYYRYPELYLFYRSLSGGQIDNIYGALTNIFKASYGYAHKDSLFYIKIKKDPGHFKVLYEDDLGIIFQVGYRRICNDPISQAGFKSDVTLPYN